MRRRGAFVGASMKPGIHCRSDVEPHWEGFPLAKGTCVSLIPRIPRAQDTCVNIPRISGYSTLAKVTCMSGEPDIKSPGYLYKYTKNIRIA